MRALFRDADLTGANFTKADLTLADFTDAVLDDTDFEGADVSNVNFRDATGLTQSRLDAACADFESGPYNLPNESRTGNHLVWKDRRCPG